MTRNSRFLQAEATQAWLSQFEATDQSVAIELLQRMNLVTRDAFIENLRSLILSRLKDSAGPIGLYAEREVRARKGVPSKLFKESDKPPRRAYGIGPEAVKPAIPWNLAVGSEGIVAQLVSEICKTHIGEAFNHPGPGLIRKHKIRRFVLVTDFIGSGDRVLKYLKAAWRVRSVRSWWSSRATKGLEFEVVSYSATASGRAVVEGHASQPSVFLVADCRAISDMPFERKSRLNELCRKYNPGSGSPLGYGNVGALIAFAHGVPNNAPSILHDNAGGWAPLFQKRVTASTRAAFESDETNAEAIRMRLEDMRHTRLASSHWLLKAPPKARAWLAVLAALSHPPRTEEVISGKTGLTILDVRKALSVALAHRWITDQYKLTDTGHAELEHARGPSPTITSLPEQPEMPYYPKSLRVPFGKSS